MDERTPTELLAWRVRELEIIEKAQNLEISELREKGHEYVTRGQLQTEANVRREWPVILASVTIACATIANLILSLRGGR